MCQSGQHHSVETFFQVPPTALSTWKVKTLQYLFTLLFGPFVELFLWTALDYLKMGDWLNDYEEACFSVNP